MRKKLEWPLAKIRKEDKCPAVWLTWGVWSAIKSGLVGRYISAHEWKAKSDARIAANKRDDILDVWRSDDRDAQVALDLYRLGFQFNEQKLGEYTLTPEQLIERGQKCYARAFADQVKSMLEGPVLTV